MLLFIITLLALLATSLYLFFWYMFTYWSRHGVPFVPPTVPYGNLKDAGKVSHISECMQRFYQTLKGRGPVGGIYFYVEPVALLLDIAVIKQVLIKDFANFQSRGIYYNEVDDPLSAHLFALDGPVWKRLRGKLTPTFTSGKMRYMFATVVDVAAQFRQCIGEQLASGDAVLEMKELLARFTTDVIGTCAFGIECNSLSNPDAEFRRMGKKVFSEPRNQGAVAFLMLAFPRMARRLRMKEEPEDVSEFFMGIVRETVEYRERNGVHRNDFMDLLIEIKNEVTEDGSVSMSLEELAAQAYVFFLAGFETSSTAMSYAVYELSLNADIRERARKEVHAVLARFDGELTYEAVMAMPYIEQILNGKSAIVLSRGTINMIVNFNTLPHRVVAQIPATAGARATFQPGVHHSQH